MGKLGVHCLTSTPDSSTFYGLDYAYSYDYIAEYKSGYSFVIYKSNTNPPSPQNLTWSLVSRVYAEELAGNPWNDYTCAVDANGVFTFFFQDLENASIPSGVRYDPNGIADSRSVAGSKGPGTWRSINVSTMHQWDSDAINQALQYVDSPSGPLLLHCIIRDHNVQFASYDEAANSLNHIGSWNLQYEYIVARMVFTISRDHLYVLFRTSMSFGTLYSYPLSSMRNSTLPVYKNYTSPATRSCGDSPWPRLFTSQKALYLLCDQLLSSRVSNELYTIKDPDTDTSLGTAELLASDVWIAYGQTFSTLGGGAGQAHFLLFRTDSADAGILALPLDGPSRASINTTRIIIDDTSGSDMYTTSSRSFDLEVVGSIAAVVLVGFLSVFFYRRRRRQLTALRGSQTAAGPVTDTTGTTDIDSKPTPPAGSIHHQQQQPEMSTPAGPSLPTVTLSFPPPSTPTTMLPMAPIPATPQYQSVQDQMIGLQLSQHPRPAVENARPANNNAVVTAPHSFPWQPTPFVPPQRIRAPEQDDSTSLSLPSAVSPPLIPRSSRPGQEVGLTSTPPPIHNPHA